MNGLFNVRKADISDIKVIQKLIKNLAEYEKRPQDMLFIIRCLAHLRERQGCILRISF